MQFCVFFSFLFFTSSRSKLDRVITELPRIKANQTLRDRGKLKNYNIVHAVLSLLRLTIFEQSQTGNVCLPPSPKYLLNYSSYISEAYHTYCLSCKKYIVLIKCLPTYQFYWYWKYFILPVSLVQYKLLGSRG